MTKDEDDCIVLDVADIGLKWANDNGREGFYNPDAECACPLDDFAPCHDGLQGCCIPGFITLCLCGGHEFHISARKPKREDFDAEDWETLEKLKKSLDGGPWEVKKT